MIEQPGKGGVETGRRLPGVSATLPAGAPATGGGLGGVPRGSCRCQVVVGGSVVVGSAAVVVGGAVVGSAAVVVGGAVVAGGSVVVGGRVVVVVAPVVVVG